MEAAGTTGQSARNAIPVGTLRHLIGLSFILQAIDKYSCSREKSSSRRLLRFAGPVAQLWAACWTFRGSRPQPEPYGQLCLRNLSMRRRKRRVKFQTISMQDLGPLDRIGMKLTSPFSPCFARRRNAMAMEEAITVSAVQKALQVFEPS